MGQPDHVPGVPAVTGDDTVVAYTHFEVSLHSLMPRGKTKEQLESILADVIATVFPPELDSDLEVELIESTAL